MSDILCICTMNNNRTISQFFSLLRAGLWNSTIDETIFEGVVDWKKILQLSHSQTVAPIVFDGIQGLVNTRCEKRALMEWISITQKIESRNNQLNKSLGYFVNTYRKVGLDPVVIKGQCIAKYYNNPRHRQPGDIDFYFSNGYEISNEIVAKLPNARESEATTYHKAFNIGGISIENHLRFVDFYSHKNKKTWDNVLGLLENNMYEIVKIEILDGEEIEVKTFSPQLNSIYLFLHLQHHLLQTGIGMRQVCDWACLWYAKEKKIDKELFLKVVDMLPIRRSMTALAWIVENYLGLPKGIIPLDTTSKQACKDGAFLLEDIMSGGNFGKDFGFMDGFKRNNHLNNIRTYISALKRMIKLRRLCPSEVDAYIIYYFKERLLKGN